MRRVIQVYDEQGGDVEEVCKFEPDLRRQSVLVVDLITRQASFGVQAVVYVVKDGQKRTVEQQEPDPFSDQLRLLSICDITVVQDVVCQVEDVRNFCWIGGQYTSK